MPYANDEDRRRQARNAWTRYRRKHRTQLLAHWKESRVSGYSAKFRAMKLERKKRVLSHYGPAGILQCCSHGCEIRDIDMLTLDHIKNDGAEWRRTMGVRTGDGLYNYLERNNYPDGFQTMCANHQLKKQLLAVRAKADAAYHPRIKSTANSYDTEKRRIAASGFTTSKATRRKQSVAQKARLARPGELERLIAMSPLGHEAKRKKNEQAKR
jgi:hypothetical protein